MIWSPILKIRIMSPLMFSLHDLERESEEIQNHTLYNINIIYDKCKEKKRASNKRREISTLISLSLGNH